MDPVIVPSIYSKAVQRGLRADRRSGVPRSRYKQRACVVWMVLVRYRRFRQFVIYVSATPACSGVSWLESIPVGSLSYVPDAHRRQSPSSQVKPGAVIG